MQTTAFTETDIFQRLWELGWFNKYDKKLNTQLVNAFLQPVFKKYWQPDTSCVYVWRDGDVVIYVGQSKDWRARLNMHLISMFGHCKHRMYQHFLKAHQSETLSVEVLSCAVADLDDTEAALINTFSSTSLYNVEHNTSTSALYAATDNGIDLAALLIKIKEDEMAAIKTDKLIPLYIQAGFITQNECDANNFTCCHCGIRHEWNKLRKHFDSCKQAVGSDSVEFRRRFFTHLMEIANEKNFTVGLRSLRNRLPNLNVDFMKDRFSEVLETREVINGNTKHRINKELLVARVTS